MLFDYFRICYFIEILFQFFNCVTASLDESEVNKVSQLEIVVNIVNQDGTIDNRHYRTLDIEAPNAETITSTFQDTFEDDKID